MAVWRAAGRARAPKRKLLADQVRTRGCWGTGGARGDGSESQRMRRSAGGRADQCLRTGDGRVAARQRRAGRGRWNFKFNLIFNASNSARLANRMSRTFRNEDSGMFREIRNRWFVSFKSPNPYGRPLRRTLPLRSSPRQIKRCELLHGYLP